MLHKLANIAMERISFKSWAKAVLTFWSSHGKQIFGKKSIKLQMT